MKIGKSVKTLIAGTMAVACLASVAACGPGSSSSKSNANSEPVSTDVSKEKVELKLWDGAGLKTFDDQLIAAFQKKYPNITIKATYDPDNTSQQNGPRIISAADTPDVARITDINSAVRGKHLVNLDEYSRPTDGTFRIPRPRCTASIPTARSVPAACTRCLTASP